MARVFNASCGQYRSLFWCFSRDQKEYAHRYRCGRRQSAPRNLLPTAGTVPRFTGEDERHFPSGSPWEYPPAIARAARQADALRAGQRDPARLLDETCGAKNGGESVGVARRYLGRLGKVDQCQAGVFAALSAGQEAVPIAHARPRRRCGRRAALTIIPRVAITSGTVPGERG